MAALTFMELLSCEHKQSHDNGSQWKPEGTKCFVDQAFRIYQVTVVFYIIIFIIGTSGKWFQKSRKDNLDAPNVSLPARKVASLERILVWLHGFGLRLWATGHLLDRSSKLLHNPEVLQWKYKHTLLSSPGSVQFDTQPHGFVMAAIFIHLYITHFKINSWKMPNYCPSLN